MDSLFNDDDLVRCGYMRGEEIVFVDNNDEFNEYISGGGCGWQLQRPTHGPLAGRVLVSDELGSEYFVGIANEHDDAAAILKYWG